MSVTNINPEKEPIPRSWVPRVITGGKEPPSECECWLRRLPVGCIFVARENQDYRFNLFELIYKGDKFYLLHLRMGDATFDQYVSPEMFCNKHIEYEILPNPPIEEETNEEQHNRTD